MCIDSYNEPTVLSDNEQAAIAIVKAAFEQANLRFDIIDMCHRSTDYLTLLTPDGVDFCRIKAGARSTWISLDMWTYKGSAKDDTRFDSYANKKNRHWQINLRCIDDIASVADLIVAVFADICGNMEDISTNYTPLTNPSQLTTLTVKANKFADVHDYVVFDLETTGLERDCAIIEIGAVKIRNDIIVDRFCTLVNPGQPIPYEATKINGITDAMVADAPNAFDAISGFYTFFGNDTLIGHNIKTFDMPVLSRHVDALLGCSVNNDVIDTLSLAKHCINLDSYRLTNICAYFGIVNDTAHRAMSDVEATALCFAKLQQCDYCNCSNNHTANSAKHFKPKYSEESKALQELQNLLADVTSDGLLTSDEVISIKQWLDDYKQLSGNYPFDKAYTEIGTALADGVLTANELDNLLQTFVTLINPLSTEAAVSNTIDITNKVICLTGEFAHGAKSDIASKLVAMGAQMSDNVTKKVNILVVGSVGSQAWTYGNYGGKVKKAMELRDKGSDITIIGEEDLLNNIAVTV